MRIAMPIMENKGKDSRIHPHFGHVQFMAVYDSVKRALKIVPVKPIQGCSPIAALEGLDVDTIYTMGMGMRAMSLCGESGIKLKTGRFSTVREVIENLDSLEDLNESCGH
jgi:predicted Fe-Mo cluster-binding NifX family protein